MSLTLNATFANCQRDSGQPGRQDRKGPDLFELFTHRVKTIAETAGVSTYVMGTAEVAGRL